MLPFAGEESSERTGIFEVVAKKKKRNEIHVLIMRLF